MAIPTEGRTAPAAPASGAAGPEFRVVDKRHFADPTAIPVTGPVDDKPRYPSYVEELQARVVETERRYEQKRKQVDEEIARMRTRLEAEVERRLQHEKAGMLVPLLEVLDNLERTLASASAGAEAESLIQGVRMTAGLFRSRLRGLGVEPIEALDREFDPNHSQAIGTVDVTDAGLDGMVVEELQRGYKVGEQLLRPAQVRVGRLVPS
jgi:molecular chaperone GrpE